MRSLPHIAIGCGAVWAGARLIRRLPGNTEAPLPEGSLQTARNGHSADETSVVDSIDYRLVAFGSLLPDTTDRLLRAIAGGRSWSPHQHLLGHTLLFHVPVLLAGARVAKQRRDPRLLALGAAAVTHLMVDPVIRSPRSLFWPLLGLRFPEARGLNRALTLLTQLLAAAAIVAAIATLQRNGRLGDFLSSGRL